MNIKVGSKLYHYILGPMTVTHIDQNQYIHTRADHNGPLHDILWYRESVGHEIFLSPYDVCKFDPITPGVNPYDPKKLHDYYKHLGITEDTFASASSGITEDTDIHIRKISGGITEDKLNKATKQSLKKRTGITEEKRLGTRLGITEDIHIG